jgi:mono/diheme cytochrome c family protein
MRLIPRTIRSWKLSAVFAVAAFAIACVAPKAGRYSITTSNAYPASLFRQNCAICHGPEGEGKTLDDGRVTPNIRDGEHKYKTDEQIYNHIANGGNGMVPFRDILTEREIKLMVEFVQHDLRGNNK